MRLFKNFSFIDLIVGLTLLLLLGASGVMRAQSTTVSVTVVDGGGQVWTNGSISYVFQGNSAFGGNYYWDDAPLPKQYLTPTQIALDGSGFASFSLPSSTAITPAGTSWRFVVCPNASTSCQTVILPITGSTQDISTIVTAALAPLKINALNVPRAYTKDEIQLSINWGALFYDVSASCFKGWNGSSYSCIGASGSPIGPASGSLFGTYPSPGVAQVNGTLATTSTINQNNLSGSLLSRQYQSTISSNNGIANAAAAMGSTPWTQYLGPDYLYTDRIGFLNGISSSINTTMPTNTSNGSSLYDYRAGQYSFVQRNAPLSNLNGGVGYAGQQYVGLFDTMPGWTPSIAGVGTTAKYNVMLYSTPGYDYGNPGIGAQVNWTTNIYESTLASFWGQGIHAGHQQILNCLGAGDCNREGWYDVIKPARTRGGDEGYREIQANVNEAQPYTAVVSSSSTANGLMTVTATNIGGGGIGGLGDGHPVIDLGKAIALSSAATASGGNTVYTYTSSQAASGSNGYVGHEMLVSGFVTNTVNNGSFAVVASTTTTVTLGNASGVAETHAATTTLNMKQCVAGTTSGTTFAVVNVSGCPITASLGHGTVPAAITIPPNVDGSLVPYVLNMTGLSSAVSNGDLIQLYDTTFLQTSAASNCGAFSGGAESCTLYLKYSQLSSATWCAGGEAGKTLSENGAIVGNYIYVMNILCSTGSSLTVSYESSQGMGGWGSWNTKIGVGTVLNIYHSTTLMDARNMSAPNLNVDGTQLVLGTSDSLGFPVGDSFENTNHIVGSGNPGEYQKYLYVRHNPYSSMEHSSTFFSGVGMGSQTNYMQVTNQAPANAYNNAGCNGATPPYLHCYSAPTFGEWDGPIGGGFWFQYEPLGFLNAGNVKSPALFAVGGLAPGQTNSSYDILTEGSFYVRYYNSLQSNTGGLAAGMLGIGGHLGVAGTILANTTHGALLGQLNSCFANTSYDFHGIDAPAAFNGNGFNIGGGDKCGLANWEIPNNGSTAGEIRLGDHFAKLSTVLGNYGNAFTGAFSTQNSGLQSAAYIGSWANAFMFSVDSNTGAVRYPWIFFDQNNGTTKNHSGWFDQVFQLHSPGGIKTSYADALPSTPTGTGSTTGGTIPAGNYTGVIVITDVATDLDSAPSGPSTTVTTTGTTSSITWVFASNTRAESYKLYNNHFGTGVTGNAFFTIPTSACTAGVCTYTQTTFTAGAVNPVTTDNSGGFDEAGYISAKAYLQLRAYAGATTKAAGELWNLSGRPTWYDGSTTQSIAYLSDIGSGSVSSIATTGPITGGTITSTGTIGCATCGVTGSPLSQFAATTSAQLAGVISDETGTGAAVFAGSPAFTGTPTVPTQSAFDNSTKAASTAYVDAAVGAAASWTISDVTASRAFGTAYQAGTSPLTISGYGNIFTGSMVAGLICSVGPTSAAATYFVYTDFTATITNSHATFNCPPVPANYWYKITPQPVTGNYTTTVNSIGQWIETIQ